MGESPEEKKAREEAEKSGNLISTELARELVRNPNKFDELTPEQKTEFHTRFVEMEEEVPENKEEEEKLAAEEEKKDPPKPTESEEGADTSTETGKEKKSKEEEEDPDKQALKAKLKESKDEINTLSQKLNVKDKRVKALEDMRIPEPPKVEDEYETETAKAQSDFNRKVAEGVNQWVDAESASLKKETSDLREKTMYVSAGVLQQEFSELDTSKSLEVLDKVFIRFRNDLAGPGANEEARKEATTKFFNDAEFRKAKEADGIVLPIKEDDWKNYQLVSQILNFKRTGGDPGYYKNEKGEAVAREDKYPDLDVAYYAFRKSTGFIPDPVKEAAIETTQKVVDKMEEKDISTTVLSPDAGTGGGDEGGMTEAQAEQWLLDHPTASTLEEKRILREIMSKFSSVKQDPASREVVF